MARKRRTTRKSASKFCKRKGANGKPLRKARVRGSDGRMRTVCKISK